MAENFGGMNRIIRHLEEELVELESAGLYERADEVRKKIGAYVDMRNRAHVILHRIEDDKKVG